MASRWERRGTLSSWCSPPPWRPSPPPSRASAIWVRSPGPTAHNPHAMGLHTAEAVFGGDNYVGVDVHRAARIAAVSHGGQILISDATRSLAASSMPDGIVLSDLGTHRLKDLLRGGAHLPGRRGRARRRLPSARDAHDPAEQPPDTGIDVPGAPRGDGIRCRTLTDEGARLVTLTGPGGIGKTRLALQVAAELADHFVDGVFFVDLSPARDDDAAFEAIARAVGIRAVTERPSRGSPRPSSASSCSCSWTTWSR